jgi:hypothetical protein
VAPPERASFKRGLGVFHLTATDGTGQDVRQFDAPLALAVAYTPEQLRVLGIAEADLTLSWFDEAARPALPDDSPGQGQWVPLATTVDAATGTATAQVDHFTPFQLSDGSSPSETFIPSLKGWQVSLYTGSASFSYPIEVPAGPAGLKPTLTLSYASAATDGKGWSLDPGSIGLNKIGNNNDIGFSLSFGGQSYQLVRGDALVGTPVWSYPLHWSWRPSDESFIKVQVSAASSLAGRGGSKDGVPYPRYRWDVWDKDGTRYEFTEDAWWGWACGQPGGAYLETNRWRLSRIVDTQQNTITFSYGRDTVYREESCAGPLVVGYLDRDIYLTGITYGANLTTGASDRFSIEFHHTARTNDTQFEDGAGYIGGNNTAPRETRVLNVIRVVSKQDSSWQLVRRYNLAYDYSLLSDASYAAGGGTYTGDPAYPKLMLTSITWVANDGMTVLPSLPFT